MEDAGHPLDAHVRGRPECKFLRASRNDGASSDLRHRGCGSRFTTWTARGFHRWLSLAHLCCPLHTFRGNEDVADFYLSREEPLWYWHGGELALPRRRA